MNGRNGFSEIRAGPCDLRMLIRSTQYLEAAEQILAVEFEDEDEQIYPVDEVDHLQLLRVQPEQEAVILPNPF